MKFKHLLLLPLFAVSLSVSAQINTGAKDCDVMLEKISGCLVTEAKTDDERELIKIFINGLADGIKAEIEMGENKAELLQECKSAVQSFQKKGCAFLDEAE